MLASDSLSYESSIPHGGVQPRPTPAHDPRAIGWGMNDPGEKQMNGEVREDTRGFGVHGFGFEIWGLGFRVQGCCT